MADRGSALSSPVPAPVAKRRALSAASLDQHLRKNFETAWSDGFPLYCEGERDSNALNSSPYLTELADFSSKLDRWGGRSELLDEIHKLLESLERTSFRIVGMLVGGSFVDRSVSRPQDVDLLLLFETDGGASHIDKELCELRRAAHDRGIDARFIPTDRDPLIFAKTISYFTTLYNSAKESLVQSRSLILVDCRREDPEMREVGKDAVDA